MRADLALIGFGNVARQFVRLLDERRVRLQRDEDLDCRIVSVVTRAHGTAYNADGLNALEAARLVENGKSLTAVNAGGNRPPFDAFDAIVRLGNSGAALRIVVETTTLDISGGEPAVAHVSAALAADCDVVTANKGPVAFAYSSLHKRAEAAGRAFLFEGAVMDGVPIFNLVRETLPAIQIVGFRGVVNSTTNHILTALEEGEPFDSALARMQAVGIAEADASLDLDGWDAAAKAAALANVLMDANITPHDVQRRGIGSDAAEIARAAKTAGKRLKLVASATRGALPVVEPVALDRDDPLAGLRGTANALILRTDVLGEIGVYQFEGSLSQTAYALLTDLITIRRRALRAAPARRTP